MRKNERISTAMVLGAALTLMVCATAARAESVAAKNRQGNRLFSQGKYVEAEKAYLDAQVQAPGRPELLYNLGNALIKQKKYDQAIQSLRQATSKGDKGLEENSWYNTGNALYDMGKFQEASQAYIQALRINPSDRDAKFNLELALQRMKQQKQMGGGKDEKDRQQQSQNSRNQQQPENNPSQQQKPPKQQSSSEGQNRDQAANPKASQAEQKQESLSRERALQILDALKDEEIAEQRKLLEKRARRKMNARDW